MAGRGPAPKDPEKRRRRNADTVESTDLAASAPLKRARPLPGSRDRHPRTRRWWRVAARSPQAAQFLETDWLVMERLADLYDAFFGGATTVASEIRLCEAKLGFTPEDRLRLRWTWRSPVDPSEGDAGGEQPGATSSSRRGRDPRLTALEGGKAS